MMLFDEWCVILDQGLFVGDNFEVNITDGKDHIHSIELRYVNAVL